MHIPRIIRQFLIGTLALSVLLAAAGIGYALYSEHATPDQPVDVTTSAASTAPPIKRTAASPNAPASAAVEAISSPIQPGGEASITVQTLEGAVCTIDIGYSSAPNATSLQQQTANEYGIVSWNWTVALSAPVGSWPVKVMCVYHTRSAVVETNLQITR